MALRSERKNFVNPPSASRPLSLWTWHGPLDAALLGAQFEALIESGMGGVILDTKGQASEAEEDVWFETVNALAKRAKRRKASLCLHEGPHWNLPEEGEDLLRGVPVWAAEYMVAEDLSIPEEGPISGLLEGAYALFVVTSGPEAGQGSENMEYLPVLFHEDLSVLRGHRVLRFYLHRDPSQLNFLDSRTAAAVIAHVHDPCYLHLKRSFGQPITRLLMEQPLPGLRTRQIPWDPELETLFKETRGYALGPVLPALFFPGPDAPRVRFDYWGMVGEMYREGFAAPMSEWCSEKKLSLSIPSKPGPSRHSASGMGGRMPLYYHQTLPALRLDSSGPPPDDGAFGRRVMAVKEAASVANQFDKEGVLAIMGPGASDAHLAHRLRAGIAPLTALGVTHVAYHGAVDRIGGAETQHLGDTFDAHQPYWPFLAKHFQSLGRTGWLLSQGHRKAGVLVIHPESSFQIAVEPNGDGEKPPREAASRAEIIERHFVLLSAALVRARLDFDYGDEELMATHGTATGDSLQVGSRKYPVVVLPPLMNLRSSTLALLVEFAMGGGRVLVAGTAPALLDGAPSKELADFIKKQTVRIHEGVDLFRYDSLVAALEEALVEVSGRGADLSFKDGPGPSCLIVQRRQWRDREIVHVANGSAQRVCAGICFDAPGEKTLELWDPCTGLMEAVTGYAPDSETALECQWQPYESHTWVILPGNENGAQEPSAFHETARHKPEWRGTRTLANAIPLAKCTLTGPGGPRSPVPLGAARRYLERRLARTAKPVRLTARWTFETSVILPIREPFEAVISLGEEPVVILNGEEIAFEAGEWWLDSALTRVPLPPVEVGANLLEVTGTYTRAEQLRSPWIRGPFRVADHGNRLVAEDESNAIGLGPWNDFGIPYYAGTVVYRASLEAEELVEGSKAVLEAPGVRGMAEVRVNGAVADTLLWEPYSCDITRYWKAGELVVEIEVANSIVPVLRAMDANAPSTGPGAGASPNGAVPLDNTYGLLSAPEVVVYGPPPEEEAVVEEADSASPEKGGSAH